MTNHSISYRNPIIPGFNPDPSICRVGNDYYLVTSTFQFFPAIPIYHSQDLVNWTQIGNVLDRLEQIPDLDKTLINGGIWAPTIRYHKGTFYVITTNVFVDKPHLDFTRWRNFFVIATKPSGPWSNPTFFEYPGYDTSFFFDDENDGQVYVQGSFYHRIRKEISQSKINIKTGETSASHRIWSGTGEKAPEAPHILYRNGWYYLIIAEGGTESGHRVTMARSKNIDSDENDWEVCPTNPVITHSDLPSELVQCVGHADLFQDTKGQWHMVLLASRAYDGDHFPMGRETFLVPVNWDGDWPIVQRPIKAVSADSFIKRTDLRPFGIKDADDYKKKQHWGMDWLWLRFPDTSKYHLLNENECILTGSDILLDDPKVSPTLVGLRQSHVKCRVTVELSNIKLLQGDNSNLSTAVGLTAYLDCKHYHAIALHRCMNQEHQLTLDHISSGSENKAINSTTLSSASTLILAIETSEREFYFEYKEQKAENWDRLATVSSKDLSTGFTGVIFGLFVTGNTSAQYSNFRYQML